MYKPIFALLLLILPFFSQSYSKTDLAHFPTEMTLNFSGPYKISAAMHFKQNGKLYEITTKAEVPFKPITFISKGNIVNNQLQPISFYDIRNGKTYAHSIYDYHYKIINYGRDVIADAVPMQGLSQDLFTLAWQMSINQGKIDQTIQTTNGKKVYLRKPFTAIGNKSITVNNKKMSLALYKSGEGYDLIELGLAIDYYFIPAIITFYNKKTRYSFQLKNFSLP